ncbi:MAG: peptidoglycan-binding domain-containing protein [Pseudobdellovibrionaceae bacterium]|jgi:rubrerythrin|nr:peptidoglycan-binding domain-containing protein [Pseudobdellovibrionaceae bacterium]
MKLIKLSNSIRRNNADMNFQDILNMKNALHHIGYYDVPDYGITEYPDNKLYSSLEKFQKDRKLTVDGVANPGGETEKAINEELKITAKSPIIRCTVCGGPHGGSKGDVCPDCDAKM